MYRLDGKGFTLIELMVVIVIVSVLGMVGLSSYRSANVRSRDARRVSDIEEVRMSLESYRLDNGSYPVCNGGSPCTTTADCFNVTLSSHILNTYINKMPVDPKDVYGLGYEYCSDGATYRLKHTSEKNGAQYMTNPL